MNLLHRRKFLKAAGALCGLGLSYSFAGKRPPSPKLSFSTLGCPDWTFINVLDFAVKNQYQGIEIRGIQRELDLIKCPAFDSKEHIQESLALVRKKGLRIVDLGSSAELHHADPAKRQENLAQGRRFIDLAQQLECPHVRVFPNSLPKEQDRGATLKLISEGLLELGRYAAGKNVTVLMETHGDLAHTSDVETVMQAAEHPNTGIVWDVINMWSVTKEPPATVYERLKKYIRHTHIKDLKIVDDKLHYMLLGKGESPIFEGIDALYQGGYQGFYSFEWEKLWHPEIEEPEVAIAGYPVAMRKHFAGISGGTGH